MAPVSDCESRDEPVQTVMSPCVVVAKFLVFAIPCLGFVIRGPWGLIACGAMVGTIITGAPEWVGNNYFDIMDERWLAWRLKRNAKEETKRHAAIEKYRALVENPTMRYKVVIKSGEILLPSGSWLWCALLPLNFSNRGTVQLGAFIAAAAGWLILSNTEVNEEALQRLETEYKPPAEYSFRMLRDFANRASKVTCLHYRNVAALLFPGLPRWGRERYPWPRSARGRGAR
jgi:hypothetical protein